jgi:3-dehydroquinate dehydratase-2
MKKIPHILLLNGPNLNLLGQREAKHYGSQTLADLESLLQQSLHDWQTPATLTFFQSNHEGALVDAIQQGQDQADYFIINAGAYTHTSIALRDALLAVKIPFIECHLSNVHARETFRQQSYLADIARGVITGFGLQSYRLALLAALTELTTPHL